MGDAAGVAKSNMEWSPSYQLLPKRELSARLPFLKHLLTYFSEGGMLLHV